MSRSARLALAAAILGIGLIVSQRVRELKLLMNVDASRLGFEMLGIELGLAAIAVAGACALPGRVRDRLGLRRGRLPASAVVALVLGTLGVSEALNGLLSLTRAHEHSVVVGIARGLDGARGWGLVVALLGTVIAPAVSEELLCRGLLQRSAMRWVGPGAALAASTLVFGVIHMELVHGVVAATIGLYLGITAYWADSTRPAILGHAMNNFAALLGTAGLVQLHLPIFVSIAMGLALAIGGLLWAWRARPRGAADVAGAALQPERDPADA